VILLFDNYDSFTYNLLDLVQQLNVEVKIVRNDELSLLEIINLNPHGIIISPGPGRPEQSGILMELISQFYNKVPILGVCLGMQALGLHFGAKLSHAKYPMHGKTSNIFHTNHEMFDGIPNGTEMMRYHSLILENIPSEFRITAETKNSEIMSIAHTELPIWAVQFHPESILSKNGVLIIRNWLAHFQLINDFKAFC
jgi:anthranilate synthase component 2